MQQPGLDLYKNSIWCNKNATKNALLNYENFGLYSGGD